MDGGAQFPMQECSKWTGCVRAYDRESMKSISLGSHNLTKLNRTSSSICVRFCMEYDIWLWQDIAYHWGTCLFRFFFKTTPDFKHHQNKLAQPYLPYLNSQQLRLGSSICNPQNFQIHWQDICITNRFKLKRTLIFKTRHNRHDREKQNSSF